MARDEKDAATISVELAYSPRAGELHRIVLELPAGATVADALARSGWELPPGLQSGIWSRPCGLEARLRDRDRLELYRELKVDPKEARRARYRARREQGGR